MAWQFGDGFDLYGTGYSFIAGYPWDTILGSPQAITTDYRFAPPSGISGGCTSTFLGNTYLRKTLSGNLATIIVGFGVKFPSLSASGTNDFVYFYDNGNTQCGLAVTPTGRFRYIEVMVTETI
jgi:hypothetical protein